MPVINWNEIPYTMNNDNAECWYILVFDCSLGNFVFRNPCDLISECQLDINDLVDWDTFDWCQMVSSPLLDNMDPGNFVRVNSTGTCLEWVDPTTLSWLHDYRVRVTAADTEDYLQQKIVWTTNRVSVSLVPGVNQQLKIDIIEDWIDWLLPSNPSCIDPTYNPTWYAQLVYDDTSGVHWECQQNRWDSYWHQRYIISDIIINSWNTWFPEWWTVWWSSYWYVNTQESEWLPSMNYLLPWNTPPHTFPAWTEIPAIKIQETWLYAVWANADVLIEWAIRAIRFFLYTNNTKTMIVNMKEWVENYSPAPVPPIFIVPTWAKSVTKTFSWYNLVKLNKWEYIFMWVRVFTPDPSPFSFTILSKAFPLDVPIWWGSSWNLCGTTFWCQLVSKSVLDSS